MAIADIDTRKLTRLLREKGAQNGCIIAGDNPDAALALEKAKAFPGLNGMDLAKEVTTTESYSWTRGAGRWRATCRKQRKKTNCRSMLSPMTLAPSATFCACWWTEAVA